MSTYYYFICEYDKTRVFAGSCSQGGSIRFSGDISDWMKAHMGDSIMLVSEHMENLHEYTGED